MAYFATALSFMLEVSRRQATRSASISCTEQILLVFSFLLMFNVVTESGQTSYLYRKPDTLM